MIPIIVAEELRATLLDYLDTTFSFQDVGVGRALQDFLSDPDTGIFKGPYVHLQLPYRRDPSDVVDRLLDIRPPFQPYQHQTDAFERLSSREGHQPQPTIVTTGTGSGKTECFLYPVLDHCYRQIGKPGIKAIILYPMNALAADQASRLAKVMWKDPRLKGKVTAGMYVGGKGTDRTMGPENVITDREVLRSHPPDILLTNYKMLDFLLLRPEDQKLWRETGPASVQYLVLDELHTYDGAQGSDVACLIRRLKAKLKSEPGSLCCVGTSATLAGDAETAKSDLVSFASTLFGERFPHYSVVSENRLQMSEYLGDQETYDELPVELRELRPLPDDTIERFIDRQCSLWFARTGLDEIEVGEQLRQHAFLRTVLMRAGGKIVEWSKLVEGVAKWDPAFEALTTDDRDAMLRSFLSLVSYARRPVGDRREPFLTCQVQFWIREMSRLMREVAHEPRFFWRDEVPMDSDRKGLPAVYCRECGHTGWVTFKRHQDHWVSDDLGVIYPQYFDRSRNTRFLFPLQDDEPGDGSLIPDYLCPQTLVLSNEKRLQGSEVDGVPVQVSDATSGTKVPRSLQRCPGCDTDHSLTILGSQAASLSSVAISHLYHSRFSRDEEKKLLAFTDSVQDASHRSGFFASRTYRFNLRTAIQAVLEAEPSGVVRLSDYTDRLLDYWGEHVERPSLVATFMPPDLVDLPEYRSFVESGGKDGRKVMSSLRQRLSWEIAMEFGFNARVGRTLDKVGCSTAYLNEELLQPVVTRLCDRLRNEFEPLSEVDISRFRHFIVGLLTRTRIRGGVSHPMLRGYAANQGKWFFLTKERERLMSPFGSQSRLPRFLSTVAGERVFDSVVTSGTRPNWYTDWASRCFQQFQGTVAINDLYRLVVHELHVGGVLEEIGTKTKHAYGISADALLVTRETVEVLSTHDGHRLTIPASDLANWEGSPSLGYRGRGVYRMNDGANQSYYRNIYRSGMVKRIFCHEHSGLLERQRREEVETLFKSGSKADAPNLLTCTPTLEMGIDVGDLSSTMLCSIPPTPTNYLQRIGRSGRSTGNALILALANVRPHDLYFFDQPFEMIAGTVIPPGCFLDAPEMLKRQFVGFCLDSWTSTDPTAKAMPQKVQFLLADNQKGGFPKSFLDYVAAQRTTLTEGFLGLFEGDLSEESQARLRQYALSDEFPNEMDGCLERTESEIEQWRLLRNRIKDRRDKVEAEPHKHDNPEVVLEELKQEMGVLARMIRQVNDKYPLNLFTDEGLLPNYAFPETGVKLRSVIFGVQTDDSDVQGGTTSLPFEYMRGASTAIRELAPFNTFYAESRKVVVDQVETGGRNFSQVEEWRFCDVCPHVEPEHTGHNYKTCPHCGSTGWEDVGQKRPLLRLTKVSSRSHNLSSHTDDNSDERERRTYLLKDFIDIDSENWGGGYADDQLPFGVEYLHRVTLREVNFGLKETLGKRFTAAGEQIPEAGFETCADCGVVHDHASGKPPQHRYWCYYTQAGRKEEWTNLFLYREVESEAIRILLPVSTFETHERLATFTACLELGLRRKFRGNPDHLIIRQQAEPTQDADGVPRQFLVLYDTVPGGTGYLKEFARNPRSLRDVLEEAFKTLRSCVCRTKDSSADGCYRCVYAYQRQYDLQFVSRELGIEMLSEILARWDHLEEVQTLSKVDIPTVLVESELEKRFQASLVNHLVAQGHRCKKVIAAGKECFEFSVDGRTWRLEPQVDVGPSDGVSIPSRPDFVIRNVKEEPGVLPVAVFTDGFAYHVQPQEALSRVVDDIAKRTALIRSGRFRVWSITWDDVEVFSAKNSHSKIAAEIPMLAHLGLPTGTTETSLEILGKLPLAGVRRLVQY